MFQISVALILETACGKPEQRCPLGPEHFSDLERRVSGVRLLEDAHALEDDVLYIAETPDGTGDDASNSPAVCTPPKGCSVARAYNLLLGAFEHWRTWYENCLHLICTGASTDTVLDAVTTDLLNPVAFLDDAGSIIYHSGTFEKSAKGTFWEGALERGYVDFALFSEAEQTDILHMVDAHRELIRMTPQGMPQHECAIVPLYDDGVFCASLMSADVNAAFTPGQYEALILAGQLTYLEGVRKSARVEVLHGPPYYMNCLLRGDPVKEGAVVRTFERAGWKPGEPCMVYRFEIPDAASEGNLVSLYAHRIRQALPEALWVRYAGGIVAVCRKRDFDGSDAARRKQLADALEGTDVWCAVSSCLAGVMDLRAQHMQCELALRALPGYAGMRVASFEELYPGIVREALAQTLDAKCLCHPGVLRLAESEGAQDAVRLESLKTFLVNGRSVAATARSLGVHRNTLLYRLDKLQEELGVDLFALDESQLMCLLLSCLLVSR